MTAIPKLPAPNTMIQGIPAYDGWALVELKYYEHAVAVRAVEALFAIKNRFLDAFAKGEEATGQLVAELSWPAAEALREIEASGWKP